MIKKATVIFFVFIAGFLNLANPVFPHHHHFSSICYNHSHCQDAQSHGSTNTASHQHDDNGSDECCSINSAVILPSAQEQAGSLVAVYIDNHQCPLDFLSIIAYNRGEHYFEIIPFDYSPGISFLHSALINSSRGLRAPPAV